MRPFTGSLATAAARQRLRQPPHLPRMARQLSNFFNHNTKSTISSDELTVRRKAQPFTLPDLCLPDARKFYKSIAKDSKPDKSIIVALINDTPLHDKLNRRCCVGSFIEAEREGVIHCGLVIEPQRHLFDDTKIGIINAYGETIHVLPTQITFHLHDIIHPSKTHNVLSSPETAATFIQNFIGVSSLVRKQNNHLIPVVQAWYTKESTSVDIDIARVVQMIEAHNGQYKSHPLECLLFGLHIHMRSHPLEWRTTRSHGEAMKLITSDSVPVTTYTANSQALTHDLEAVVNMDEELISSFNRHLRILREGITPNILTHFRDSTQRESDISFAEVNMIVDFLKYYFCYPHPLLKPTLENLVGDAYPTDSTGLSSLLTDLGANDPLFNAEFSFTNIQPLRLQDTFRHIRFTNSNTAYAFPSEFFEQLGLPKHSDLAISLDKTSDPNNYIFNIHIPDAGSFLPQNSKALKHLLERATDVDLTNTVKTLFSRDDIRQLSFSETDENTCLTISIKYPEKEDKPWYKTKSTVRLERLVNLKYVPLSDLNELWRSKFPVLSDLFNFFMPSDAFEVLTPQDKTTLMNVFSMIDYWFLKRGNHYSMEYQFNRRKFTRMNSMFVFDEEQEKNDFLKYITQEIKYIASEHVLKFQKQHKIPMLIQRQEKLSPLEDSLHIESNNMMIPSYEATNYEELTFYKDNVGMTPIMSYIGASHFLSPVITGTERGIFTSLGLVDGFVQVCEPLHDFESVLNHWQLINHLQEQFVASQEDYKMGLKTMFMKSYHMMDRKELMDFYEMQVKPLQLGNKRLEEQSYLHSVLKVLRIQLEQHPKVNWNIFKCVILRPSNNDELAHGYCLDLGIPVLVRLPPSLPHVKIGDQLICSQIAAITHDELILQA